MNVAIRGMIKKAIWNTIFLLIAISVFSQSKNIRFRRITIDDGLSLSSVYTIFQDSKGFMWFGTEDGLNRYDGKNFRIFRPDEFNPNSISHRWIDDIYEDKNGYLWFCSRGGLTSFNPKTETFIQYKNELTESRKISNDTVLSILEDNRNQLWVGTKEGLNRIDLYSDKAYRLDSIKKKYTGLNSRINTMLLDDAGTIWIGTNQGLYYYNEESEYNKLELEQKGLRILSLESDTSTLWIGTNKGLISYGHSSGNTNYFKLPGSKLIPKPEQFIEDLLIDSLGRIWVGNINGLYQFDIDKLKFSAHVYAPEVSNSQTVNPIKPIQEDTEGNIWYGTFGTGLYKIDTNNLVSNYANNPSDPRSLSSNSIHSVFEDQAGTIWIGTFGAGISIYDPQSHKFELITSNPSDPNSLASDFVWSILEADDGTIWAGTNEKGISRYFPKTKKIINYDFDPLKPGSLSNSTVRFIFQDSRGTIWVATDGGGLNKFNPQLGNFTHYKTTRNVYSISSNFVRGIYEDKDGYIWIGTKNGLNRLDPNTGIFKRYLKSASDNSSISHSYTYTGFHQDKEGNLWVGTIGGGLNKMDVKNETFKSFLNIPDNPESLSDNMIFWIYQDESGYLWLSTNSGLNRFDPTTEKFQRFGRNEGLPSDVIYGSLPDENGNIWLSTNQGISKFNISSYETKNYDVDDGLQSNEFNGGALHLGRSGKMYFGGVYGLNIIDPEKIVINENKSRLVLTKFEILGQEVEVIDPYQGDLIIDEEYEDMVVENNGNYYLKESITYCRRVILDYSNNFFSFEFEALNTPLPNKVQYAYIMEGLDLDWNYSGNRNYVSYSRLKPGDYIFEVKSQNPDGLWSDSIVKLGITITPPFWQKWWFKTLVLFTILNLALFIYRFLLKSKTNKLLKAQNEKIISVNKQLTESEKNLKELNATKDKFFSIISHDLKNPFSSLLSLSETISKNYELADDEDKRSIINRIYDSAKLIGYLLENLLTWSRSQRENIDFEPIEFNLSKLIETNVNLHKIPAEKKGIKLVSNYEDGIQAFADREMIDTVIRNLISNALKFSSKDDAIEILTKKENDNVEVAIKDQGTGISEENLDKLFRIDKKYKSTGTSGEKGTGLGLVLCKEFVEKNKGNIIAESILGEGSTFKFTIPTCKN